MDTDTDSTKDNDMETSMRHIVQIDRVRKNANDSFHNHEFNKAIEQYEHGIDEIDMATHIFTQQIADLKFKLHLNNAAAYLKKVMYCFYCFYCFCEF